MTCMSILLPARELNKGGISESCERKSHHGELLFAFAKRHGKKKKQSGRVIVIAFVLMNAWLLLCEVGRMSRVFFFF